MKRIVCSTAAVALFCAGLGFAALPASGQGAPPQGAWARVGEMTTTRADMGVAQWGGKIYVIGGQAMGRTDSALTQEFDPATGRWRDLAPMPRGASHVGVAVMDGKIYAAGGFLANVHRDPIDQLAEYDIASDRWRSLAPMPAPLGSVGVAAIGGRVHVIGGRGPDARTVAAHRVYDLAAGRWSEAAPLPVARDHFGIVTLGGKIYVIGGRTGATVDNTAFTDVYDPETGRWQSMAPMPTPRSSPAVAVYRDLILFVGGECKNPQTRATFDENEAYDPSADRWITLARHPAGIHAAGLAAVGDMAYLIGGNGGCGGERPSNVIYAFRLP